MKGIIISKEGSTIKDSGDRQYVDTTTPLFKLYKIVEGTLKFNSQPSPYTFQIPHNLGYNPMYFLYMDFADSSNRTLVGSGSGASTSTVDWLTLVSGDDNNIYVFGSSRAGFSTPITGTFGYTCYIFYDRIDE